MKPGAASLVLSGLLTAFLAGCNRPQPTSEPTPISLTPSPYTLATGEQQLSQDLLATLPLEADGLAVSPASLHQCLLLAAVGSRGETLREFDSVLHLPSSLDGLPPRQGPEGVETANAIFVDRKVRLRPSYVDRIRTGFAGKLEPIDLSHGRPAIERINAWVAAHTHEHIRDLLQTLPSNAAMVLVNAIYLKADWMYPFEKEATSPESFFAPDRQLKVAMMHQQSDLIDFYRGAGWKMIELAYDPKGVDRSGLAFDCVLPDRKDGWKKLRKSLTREALNTAISQKRRSLVALSLPKLEQRSRLDLVSELRLLGLHQAFSQQMADFSAITQQGRLFVSDVAQECYIRVDERGTEAAAATVASDAMSELVERTPPQPIRFVADHPFFYFIRDTHSGEILFCGLVLEPLPPQ